MVSPANTFGVQDEHITTGRSYKAWGAVRKYGELLQSIVTFVNITKIQVYIKDKVSFSRFLDGKGPLRQRYIAAKAIKRSKVDPAKVKRGLAALTAALAEKTNPTSRYLLGRVRLLLTNKNLTLVILAKYSHLKGDNLIKALIKEFGLDEAAATNPAVKHQEEFDAAIKAGDPKAAKTALDLLKLSFGNPDQLPARFKPFVKLAGERLVTLIKTTTDAAQRAAAAAKQTAFVASLSTLTLEKALQIIASADLKAYLGDAKIKAKFGDRLTAVIKAKLHEIPAKELKTILPYLRLNQHQKIVTFKDTNTGKTHTVLIERSGDKWAFVTQVPKDAKLYIINKGGSPVVKSEKGWPDPTFTTTALLNGSKLSDPGKGVVRKQVAGYTIEWHDKDGDGKIDNNQIERKSLVIYRPDGTRVGKGFSAEHFGLADRNGDADKTVDLDSPNAVTMGEMAIDIQTVAHYAKLTGLTFAQAWAIYNQSTSFKMVSIDSLRTASNDVRTEIRGVLASGVDVVKLLTDKGITSQIANLVLAYITKNRKSVTGFGESHIAAYLLRLTEASKFDGPTREKLFGIKGNYFTQGFFPKKVSSENYLAWLRGEDVNSYDDDDSNSVGGTRGLLTQMRETKDGVRKTQLAQQYIRQLLNKKQFIKAEKFLAGRYKAYGVDPSIKDSPDVRQAFVDAYLASKMYKKAYGHALKMNSAKRDDVLGQILKTCMANFDPKMIDSYLEIIASMGTRDAKAKSYALLAARFLKSNDQLVRKKALEILENIKTVDGKKVDLIYRFDTTNARDVLADYQGLGIDVGEKGTTLGILLSKVKIALKATNQLLLAERNIKIHRDPRALGNAIELRKGLSVKDAIKEVAELDKIIRTTTNPYHKARALYIKGMLIYAIVKKFPKSDKFTFKVNGKDVTITGKEAWQEAMFALRKAWEISMQTKSRDPHHMDLRQKIFTRMGKIGDAAFHITTGSRSSHDARKKFGRLLARFIPKYSGMFNFMAYSTNANQKPIGPLGYRSYRKAGSKDEYKGFKSKLTLGPNQTAPATTGKPSSGRTGGVKAVKKVQPRGTDSRAKALVGLAKKND